MPRSLKLSPENIERVKSAMQRHGYPSQKAFATELGFSRTTINKYLNGNPVDYLNFVEISEKLNLAWQAIAVTPISSVSIVGTTIGDRYKIVEQLGCGEFCSTYLARDSFRKESPCVIKQLTSNNSDKAKDLFEKEAAVLFRLGKHDCIPTLLAFFPEKEYFYLVHEFIEGNDLGQEIKEGQPWEENRAIALLQEVLEILVFIHQGNIIHRDINPHNLIRRKSDGKLVLINFGTIKQVSADIQTISIAGTPGYMPPEQAYGMPRFASDLYTLGIVGIQAITGLNPKQLRVDYNTNHLDWHSKTSVRISQKLSQILDKMVRYDFKERYQSAKEVLQALQTL
ncbi:MAG: protein kinase [Cyanobacteria bacterium SBLK]|nr:protein kinase [Cyanobacteria bacterium SBLK]